jgi:hypothetical protein
MISLASHVRNCSKSWGQLLKDVIVLGIAHIARAVGRADAATLSWMLCGDIIP